MKGENGQLYIGDKKIQEIDSFSFTSDDYYPQKLTLTLNMTVDSSHSDDEISRFIEAVHKKGVNIDLSFGDVKVSAKQ